MVIVLNLKLDPINNFSSVVEQIPMGYIISKDVRSGYTYYNRVIIRVKSKKTGKVLDTREVKWYITT